MRNGHRRVAAGCLCICLVAFLLSRLLVRSGSRNDASPVELPHSYAGAFPAFAMNETLGFERIFVLNLPNRTDRKDAITLMSLASDVQLDFVPAWSGDEVRRQSIRLPPVRLLPYLKAVQQNLTSGQVGCYRSNLNIMQRIVQNKIQSALIVQDDAEWDVHLRESLERVQDPFTLLLRSLGEQTRPTVDDPWSTKNWDIFWLGPSHEWPWPDANESGPFVKFTDPHVANPLFAEEGGVEVNEAYGLRREANKEQRDRIVQLSRRPLGMAAYAVSLAGASKILARLNTLPLYQSYDNTICAMARPHTKDNQGYEGLSCEIAEPITELGQAELRSYSVWPPLVSQFRDANGERDSDIVDRRLSTFQYRGVVGYALEIRNGVRQAILGNQWSWADGGD